MLPIESIVEINDELLTDLKVGDSFSLHHAQWCRTTNSR